MRFGKKLAVQVTDDSSGAPYLSHKLMKEAINRTVRESRTYTARQQGLGGVPPDGASGPPSQEELAKYEQQILQFDDQLFTIVEADLEKIMDHVRTVELRLQDLLGKVQERAVSLGLFVEDEQLQRLEKSLPFALNSRSDLCRQLLELRIQTNPSDAAHVASEMTFAYNTAVEEVNSFTQYLEINVAGFRKLLKRHEKQIPRRFHTRQTPFLEFHKIVTRSSRQLLDLCRTLGRSIVDTRIHMECLVGAASLPEWELKEFRGLGAECLMVLEIQKQLSKPGNDAAVLTANLLAKPGFFGSGAHDDDGDD